NLEKLSQITVIELASYDLAFQKAVFNSWDYQKKDAWIKKLQLVLSKESFSGAEISHVQKLIDHIQTGYFLKENMSRQEKTRIEFANEWINFAFNNLGWTEQFIAFLVYRLYTEQFQFEAELSMVRSIGIASSTNSESGNCNCS